MLPKSVPRRESEELLARKNGLFKTVNSVLLWLSIINFVIIYDFGFQHTEIVKKALESFYSVSLVTGFLCLGVRLLLLPAHSVTDQGRDRLVRTFGELQDH
ncbi:MAG TPA: hypothetical protein VF646_20185 [Cytophagales bacterium]